MRSRIIVHPILFAVYPVFAVYVNNVDEMYFAEVLPAAGISFAIACVYFLVARVAIRDTRKAAVLASIAVVTSLYYGFLFGRLEESSRGHVTSTAFLLLCVSGAALLVYCVIRSRSDFQDVTRVLNLIAIVLVVLSVVNLAMSSAPWTQREIGTTENLSGERNVALPAGLSGKRHIYYLIFDRYAAGRSLYSFYDFDNREFLDYLVDRGF